MSNNLEKNKENYLEHLIKLSKEVAKPWKITTWLLAGLLCLSIIGNLILSNKKAVIRFSADSNIESTISQKK